MTRHRVAIEEIETMTPLRQKMIDAMRLRGFSVRTHQSYLHAVTELARHFRRSPDTLATEDIERFFEHLVLERALAPASCRVYLNAVRFLCLHVLGHERFDARVQLPKRPQRIPELLTRREVRAIIGACANPKHRTVLATCYGCGLRVSEVVALRVRDIDGERGQLRIEQGKGAKDRVVIASPGLLRVLRGYWREYRPREWLFGGHRPDGPITISTVQRVFTAAKARAEVEKAGGIHGLRHAYATHQLEAGLPVHILQHLLGHRSIHTTLRYVHWVPGYRERDRAGLAFNKLVADGIVEAPIVIGRDHLDCGSVASPNRETEGMRDGTDAVADWPLLNALLNTASGRPGCRSTTAAGWASGTASTPAR